MAIFLESQRLTIKFPSENDIHNWVALSNEIEVIPYTSDTIQNWLNQAIFHSKKYNFSLGSVYEKNSMEFIGKAGLIYLDYDDTQPDIEIGYALHKKYWGKGYATELAKELIIWGFNHLPINQLVAVTRHENKRSQHVLEKVGMYFNQVVQLKNRNFLYYKISKSHFENEKQ